MAEFGWAYVAGGAITSSGGPDGSIQFKTGGTTISGSEKFVYYTDANRVFLTGSLIVSGNISASSYTVKNIHTIDASGSTSFGESNDDTHLLTGSFVVVPGVPALLF